MNNITVNIVEPGSGPTPAPVVPNTGLFTHGIGGPEATIITVSIVAIIAIIAAVLYYKKKHSKDNTANKVDKAGKATKLAKTISTLKTKKKASIPLAALALVVSLGTLTALLVNAGKSNTSAAEGDTENSLTVTESSEDLTIEVADEPVFAILPVELTVAEATEAGYTLTAYTDNTDLVSTTDNTKIIPMVAADEGELVALADNTYGLALDNKPASKDNEVYTALSTDQSNPTIIKSIDDYSETPAEDKTIIYYGFYITPDTPKGTYEGSAINYEAKENTATVVYDGNGKFYFDGDASTTTNTMNYIPGNNEIRYSHTPNVNDEGVQDGMYPLDSNETFVYEFSGMNNVYVDVVRTGNDNSCGSDSNDYFSIWSGAHSDYTAKANWGTALSLAGSNGKNVFDNNGKYDGAGVNVEDNAVTIAYTTNTERQSYCVESGYGYYAKVIGYNPNIVTSGEYEKPTTDGAYRFLGWSEDKDATTPTYKTAADIERALSLTTGETVTLYAISEPAVVISYNGNGADSTTNMDNVEQYTTNIETTSQVDLLASNFTKSGHGFVGWSTDQNAWEDLTDDDESNDPTIYGPNQMITVDPSASSKLTLYAVWAPAETDNSGNPVSLQDWQGCSSLTPTTYSAETGTLTVGKNTITALTDSRDGNIYTVARLADGNCWMTENLRLDNNPELSQQNTNNPSLPLTNNYEEQTTSNFLSVTSDDWCTDYDSAPCYNQSKLNTNNTALTTTSPVLSQDFTNSVHDWSTGSLNTNISSYGNYYNWYSATAGNGTYSTGEQGTETVEGDICPAGWHLPYGGNETDAKGGNTSGGFYYLNQQMGGDTYVQGSNSLRSFPNNFIYSSYRNGPSAYNRGSIAYYWSSTAYYTGGVYSLHFTNTYVNPTSGNGKDYGYSVRCLAPVE